MPEQLDFLNKAAMGEMLNRLRRAFTKQHFFAVKFINSLQLLGLIS